MPRPRRSRARFVAASRSPIADGDVVLRRISVSQQLGQPVTRLVQIDTSPGLLDMLARGRSARPSPLDVPGRKISPDKREAASPARDAASTTRNSGAGSHSGCVHQSDG